MDRSDDEIRSGQVVDDVQGRDEVVLALGRRTDVLSVLDKVLDICSCTVPFQLHVA